MDTREEIGIRGLWHRTKYHLGGEVVFILNITIRLIIKKTAVYPDTVQGSSHEMRIQWGAGTSPARCKILFLLLLSISNWIQALK